MKKFYFFVILAFCFYAGQLSAKQILVNTSNSYFSYLRNDSCFYDDQINTVSCKDHGTFQNVKKVLHEPQGIQDQLIGSIVGADGKSYDLFAMTPLQAINHAQDLLATIQATAAVLFNPVERIDEKTVKPNPYAVSSKNAAAVDALFGAKGLKVDSKIIQYFKNFYFYFEYVVKIEFAARIADYAHQNGIDFRSLLETKSWQDLVTLVEGKAGGWSALEKKLFDGSVKPDWNAIQGLIKASSWQDLVTTSFWTSLNKISNQSLTRSSFWQKYVKYTITRSFVQDQQLLLSIKQVEETIFKYIPNIEIAYYTPDFTSLRNASEMFHITLILTDALRNRYVPQCDEWQKLDDIKKIYTASLDFQKTPFYSLASYALEDQSAVYASVAQNKDPIKVPLNDEKFKQEPLLQEELLLLSMIKILHALTNYLYDSKHLETTMNVLANKSIVQPHPSIFLYAPEDYLYLEDLNLVHDSFKQTTVETKTPMALGPGGTSKKQTAKALFDAVMQNQKKIENPQVKVQGFFGDLWIDVTKNVVGWAGDVEDAGEKVWKDVEKTGKDFIDFATDAGEAIAEEAESLGFGVGAVFLSGLNPGLAKKLLDKSLALQKEVADHVENAKQELEKTVVDVENVSKDSLDVLGTVMEGVCDMTLANKDTEICKSLRGAFESAFEIIIDQIAGNLLSYISFTGGMIKLTVEGIRLISTQAAFIATKNATYEADILDQLEQFGADAAVAILEPLTFQFQYFMKSLGDVLRFCQYFISVITRIFIDVTTAITYAIGATIGNFANLFGANISASEWADAVDTALTEHERLIGTAITTGLLLASIPLTGGASVPLIAMTVGPQIFAAYGSWQADEEAIKQKKEEKEFVESFSSFVSTNSLIYQQQQNEWLGELQLKYTSELENQERNLGFYENFLANNFEALKEQYAEALGSYWSQLLSPDPSYYNLTPADVGAIYGFSSGVYELNPSQGFSLYSAARKSFSQEIAVLPELAIKTDEKVVKKVETKNWFNQKEVMILDKPVNEVEIRFQAIYLLNSFYIGLYFGGQDINLADFKTHQAETNKPQKAPLDLGQLAKMAVFKREETDGAVSFGVYEHEGKGWLTQSANAPKFQLGTWYRIKMMLQGTSLQVKVWQEPDTEPSTALIFTCSAPSPSQKVVGVISSGASIEYQFVPQIVPTIPTPKIRPEGKRCTLPCDFTNFESLQKEVDRENEARPILDYLMNPVIGKTKLNAVGRMQILRGQYIYNTDKTKLAIDGKVVEDYVVPCKTESFEETIDIVSGSIGSRPEESSYLVSLISESLFDSDMQYANVKASNIYETYVKQSGPLSTALEQKIDELRKKYFSQSTAFTLGAFSLQVNKDALQKQKNLYTAPMRDAKGIIKDQKGQPIQDYFLLTVIAPDKQGYAKTAGNPGITYSDMLTHDRDSIGITSLVSGNLYGSKVHTNYKTDYLWSRFDPDNTLPEVWKAIVQSQDAYKAVIQPSGGPSDTPDTSSSTKKTTDKDIASKTENKGSGSGKSLPPDSPANKSEQKQSEAASGGEYSFGGPT